MMKPYEEKSDVEQFGEFTRMLGDRYDQADFKFYKNFSLYKEKILRIIEEYGMRNGGGTIEIREQDLWSRSNLPRTVLKLFLKLMDLEKERKGRYNYWKMKARE